MRGFILRLGFGGGRKISAGDGNLWKDPASSVGANWVYNLDWSYTGTAAASNIDNTVANLPAGTVIKIIYTISGHTGGLVQPKIGATSWTSRSSNGTFTQQKTLIADSTTLRFDGIIAFSAKISNISFTIV